MGVLRGRCSCRAVEFEVADAFLRAYNCHCSNCRAMTGSAYLPWGEIERAGFAIAAGGGALLLIREGDTEIGRCEACHSLIYWTSHGGAYVRVPYGTLVDEPALTPTAHMFVGSKAPWHEIADDLPQYDEYPW